MPDPLHGLWASNSDPHVAQVFFLDEHSFLLPLEIALMVLNQHRKISVAFLTFWDFFKPWMLIFLRYWITLLMIIFYIEEKENRKSKSEPCKHINIFSNLKKNTKHLKIFQDLKTLLVAAALWPLLIHSYLSFGVFSSFLNFSRWPHRSRWSRRKGYSVPCWNRWEHFIWVTRFYWIALPFLFFC